MYTLNMLGLYYKGNCKCYNYFVNAGTPHQQEGGGPHQAPQERGVNAHRCVVTHMKTDTETLTENQDHPHPGKARCC
jgi:hypothetical protein